MSKLSAGQREKLLSALQARFEKHMNRHKGLEWSKVLAKLESDNGKLWSLSEMEKTGGEPRSGTTARGHFEDRYESESGNRQVVANPYCRQTKADLSR